MRASRNAVDRTRGRTVTAVLALGALIAAAVPSGVAAQTPREAREEAAPPPAEGAQPIVGIWPDMALSVGAGIGVDEVLDSNVFLRLRLGGLHLLLRFFVALDRALVGTARLQAVAVAGETVALGKQSELHPEHDYLCASE